MVRHRLLFTTAVLCIVGSSATDVIAHPPLFVGAESEERAEALGKEGNKLSREGRLAEAVAAYSSSFRISETYAVAANLGSLELKLGQHRAAAEHLAFAIRVSPADARPAVMVALKEGLADAREHVGALKIRVTSDTAAVAIDGRSIDRIDLDLEHEIFVEPGMHALTAIHPGYAPMRKTINVKAGGALDVELALVPLAPLASVRPEPGETPARAVPVPADGSIRVPLMIAGVSATTLGAALGVVFIVVANGKSSHAATLGDELRARGGAAACDLPLAANTADCARLKALLADKRTFSNAAIGSFVAVGALALGTGGIMLWSAVTHKPRSVTRPRVLPLVGARLGGLVLDGEF